MQGLGAHHPPLAMQPLQADLAGAPRGGLEGQGVDLRGGQQPMGVEQAQDLELSGLRRGRASPGREPPGALGMAPSPDLPGLGPHGNRQLEDWEGQGLWAWCSRRTRQGWAPTGTCSARTGKRQGLWAWGRRRICQGSDPTGTCGARTGNARGFGHGTGAGPVIARTPREAAGRGLVAPGVMGRVQSPDLGWLGPHGNLQLEDWGRQGSWAWCRRRSCQGLDPMGICGSRLGGVRGCGHGAVAGTARAWITEEPVPPGRGSKQTRSGGTG